MLSGGRNLDGETGQGTDEPHRPVDIIPLFRAHRLTVDSCSAGYFHSFFQCGEKWFGCGRNNYGQLGIGSKSPKVLQPVELTAFEGMNITALAGGGCHNLAVTGDNQLFSFGLNTHGQLGTKDNNSRDLPTLVEHFNGTKVKLASAGQHHSMVVTEEERKHNTLHRLWGFGRNEDGQLGINSRENHNEPQQLRFPPFLQNPIKKVCCGGCHTMIAIETKAPNFRPVTKLYTFGENIYGQLGTNKMEEFILEPQELTFNGKDVLDIAAGQHHSFALVGTQEKPGLYAFGRNSYGQLGLGSVVDAVRKPELVPIPEGHKVVQIECGSTFSCVLTVTTTGENVAFTFGRNNYLQLGLQTKTDHLKPKAVDYFRNCPPKSVCVKGDHMLALLPSEQQEGLFAPREPEGPPPGLTEENLSNLDQHQQGATVQHLGQPAYDIDLTSSDGGDGADVLARLEVMLGTLDITIEELKTWSENDITELLKDELRLSVVKRNKIKTLLKSL